MADANPKAVTAMADANAKPVAGASEPHELEERALYFKEGEVTTIGNLSGMWERTGARYDYDKDKCRCGICGYTGMPWAGWFSCDRGHVAIIKTGECFQRVP